MDHPDHLPGRADPYICVHCGSRLPGRLGPACLDGLMAAMPSREELERRWLLEHCDQAAYPTST